MKTRVKASETVSAIQTAVMKALSPFGNFTDLSVQIREGCPTTIEIRDSLSDDSVGIFIHDRVRDEWAQCLAVK